MTAANLPSMTLFLLAAGPENVEALVRRLGAASYAERQEAQAALEDLGRQALPTVRTAARDARDPEVRSRAANLVEKIESGLLTKPTMVRLDYRDRPLAEIVKGIGDQVGGPVTLVEGTMGRRGPAVSPRSATLVDPEPVPFWTAIDRLCRENDLHHGALPWGGPFEAQRAAFQLGVGGVVPGPTSDDGAFRVSLEAIEHHQVRPLAGRAQAAQAPGRRPAGAEPVNTTPAALTTDEQFYIRARLDLEPRLLLETVGTPRVTEAVDEDGRSLLPPAVADAGAQRGVAQVSQAVTPSDGSPGRLLIRLGYPELAGKRIARLRGSIPVTLAVRKAGPQVVPLDVATVGKTFRSDEYALTLKEIVARPNTFGTTILIDLRPKDAPEGPAGAFAGPAMQLPLARMRGFPTGQTGNRVEVVDSEGRPVPFSASPRFAGEVQIQCGRGGHGPMMGHGPMPEAGPDAAAATPAQLRLYEIARTGVEVKFNFADIAMP